MRSVTTTFQLSMYGMLLMSCLMLAYAEGVVMPEGLSVPLVVLAWIFVERFQVLRLPVWVANALGLAAFGLAVLELVGTSIEGRLLSGAHLLVYLSWVVLFQKKSVRHYWWISALSVLQVAVGSVLTSSAAYGLLLLAYFGLTIWTLSLFSLWQTQEKFREAEAPDSDEAATIGEAGPSVDSAPAPPDAAGRYGILRQPSQSRGMLHVDPEERWLGMRFATGAGMTAFCSMVIAALFFLFVPRYWVGTLSFGNEPTPPGVRALTGFTEKVRLGDIGRIMESTEPVLQMKLFHNDTGEPLSAEEYALSLGYEEPLFRGAMLSRYDRGDWSTLGNEPPLFRVQAAPPLGGRRVRQEITMQPIGTSILLAIHPVREARAPGMSQDVGRYRLREGIVLMDRIKPREPVSYLVYSPVNEAEAPNFYLDLSDDQRSYLREQCLRMPDLPGLKEAAERVAGVLPNQPRPRKEDMARRLVHWLRDSGEFAYSLDSSVANRELDPVEDFLLVRRQGHCEYYASALALMLRAVGIPSRMVSGFKGGKINSITGAYEVEQRHAHAWVEALINDRWVTLDATPAAPRTESLDALSPQLPAFHDLLTFAREVWSVYVLNMTFGHQRDRFYAPFQDLLTAASDALTGSRGGAPGLLGRLAEFFSSPEEWISWQGGVVSFALLCCGAAFVWAVRRAWRFVGQMRLSARAGGAALRRRVEFYERFRKLCASSGLSRSRGETQREFGDAVAARWQALLAVSDLSAVPSDVTELFYRVRFGDRELEPAEAAALDASLARLEAAVSLKNQR